MFSFHNNNNYPNRINRLTVCELFLNKKNLSFQFKAMLQRLKKRISRNTVLEGEIKAIRYKIDLYIQQNKDRKSIHCQQ